MSRASIAWFVVLSTAACGGVATSGGAGATCSARAQSAAASVQRAIDASGACNVDADCTTVGFQTGCFDSCERAVSTAGVAAVKSAIDAANANGCASFEKDGCVVTHPPCAALLPACRAGRCQ